MKRQRIRLAALNRLLGPGKPNRTELFGRQRIAQGTITYHETRQENDQPEEQQPDASIRIRAEDPERQYTQADKHKRQRKYQQNLGGDAVIGPTLVEDIIAPIPPANIRHRVELWARFKQNFLLGLRVDRPGNIRSGAHIPVHVEIMPVVAHRPVGERKLEGIGNILPGRPLPLKKRELHRYFAPAVSAPMRAP